MTTYGVYALPEDIKELELKTEETRDDVLLARYCFEASEDVRRLALDRQFHPTRETRYYDFCDYSELRLDKDIAGVEELVTENGGRVIPADSYFLKTGERYGSPPYRRIELKQDGSVNQFSWSGTPQQANSVDGYWGYMPNWADAWINSGDTVQSLTSSLLTVADVDGVDRRFNRPRFKELQLLKIVSGSTTEFLFVFAKNQADNTLSIERAVNGTSEIASPNGLTIYTWQPFDVISRYARRLAVHYYRQRGNSRADVDRPIVTPNGTILPAGFPKEIEQAMKAYRWVSISGG